MARRLLIIGLGVLLLSVAFWIHRRSPERSRPISPPIEPTTKRSAAQPPGQAPEAGRPAQAQATQPDGPAGRGLLKDLAGALRNGDSDAAAALLRELRRAVLRPIPEGENAALLYDRAFASIRKL